MVMVSIDGICSWIGGGSSQRKWDGIITGQHYVLEGSKVAGKTIAYLENQYKGLKIKNHGSDVWLDPANISRKEIIKPKEYVLISAPVEIAKQFLNDSL